MECVFSSSFSELITSKLGEKRLEGGQALAKHLYTQNFLKGGYERHPTYLGLHFKESTWRLALPPCSNTSSETSDLERSVVTWDTKV